MSTLIAVRIFLLNPILLNRIWAQDEESKSILVVLKLYCGLQTINAFAADITMVEDINPFIRRKNK